MNLTDNTNAAPPTTRHPGMPTVHYLCTQLRVERHARNIHARDLAADLGVSTKSLHAWESRALWPSAYHMTHWATRLDFALTLYRRGQRWHSAIRANSATPTEQLNALTLALATVRHERGWTLAQTAELLDRSRRELIDWENQTYWPDLHHLAHWCLVLNCHIKLETANTEPPHTPAPGPQPRTSQAPYKSRT